MRRYSLDLTTIFIIIFQSLTLVSQSEAVQRQTTSLNGNWKLAYTGSFDELPREFSRVAPVPGLIDLAEPAFELTDDSLLNDRVFWYKYTFNLKNKTDLAQLKIYKAKYRTKVFLNGRFVGENLYSFTPSFFDIEKHLNTPGKKNELIIGVGCRNMLPDTVITGNDWEKKRYIPGIYDKVEIIQSGYPFISNVQIAPNVKKPSIRIQTELGLKQTKDNSGVLDYIVRELHTGKEVKRGQYDFAGELVDFEVEIPGGRFWSPEDPFLYTLELSTGADTKTTRFGLRTFEIKKGEPYGFLNGKPYFLRGTNVTLYRFFEDSERGTLPWNDEWIIGLIKSYKEMNWNSARFCIGFPPERWYEVADSLGFLVQDEYPIWSEVIESKYLVNEFTAWMRERWNHPSVIIWDAQNETITEETGKAIRQVRSLDLSNRPWDNGWSPPQSETDVTESHPYLFLKYFGDATPSSDGPLEDLLAGQRLPGAGGPNFTSPDPEGKYYENPVIINEYGWLWLNRDGSMTTLSEPVYKKLKKDSLTTDQLREQYARYLAAMTEYWRAHRRCAGILHFCGLGYSRTEEPRGQTSDHFIDVEQLEYDPFFIKFVKPAFAPVGIMLDYWQENINPGSSIAFPVSIVNDTYEVFKEDVFMELLDDSGNVIETKTYPVKVDAIGKKYQMFSIKMPETGGKYELLVYYNFGREKVFSSRKIRVSES